MKTKEDIKRIIDSVKITDVISRFTPLFEDSGNPGRHAGLCPFCEEPSPAFIVLADSGIYTCTKCKKSGNAVNFVMQVMGVDYSSALIYLDTIDDEDDEPWTCTCNNCGHEWSPSETEHFNMSCCEVCFSTDID
jgi:DNA primase